MFTKVGEGDLLPLLELNTDTNQGDQLYGQYLFLSLMLNFVALVEVITWAL